MRQAMLLSVILASSIAASPVSAQVAIATGESPVMQQPATGDATPPPFPPMPHARPSHRCVNTCGGEAKAEHHRTTHRHEDAKTHHRGKSAHHHAPSTNRHGTSSHHGRKAKHSNKAAAHEQHALHLSRAAIRRCHNESYRQLMSDSKCRALMSEELEAKHARHRASAHKRSSKHKTTVHHSTGRHKSKHR